MCQITPANLVLKAWVGCSVSLLVLTANPAYALERVAFPSPGTPGSAVAASAAIKDAQLNEVKSMVASQTANLTSMQARLDKIDVQIAKIENCKAQLCALKPEKPVLPEEPGVPEIPPVPEGPTVPEGPGVPETPALPQGPAVPETPGLLPANTLLTFSCSGDSSNGQVVKIHMRNGDAAWVEFGKVRLPTLRNKGNYLTIRTVTLPSPAVQLQNYMGRAVTGLPGRGLAITATSPNMLYFVAEDSGTDNDYNDLMCRVTW